MAHVRGRKSLSLLSATTSAKAPEDDEGKRAVLGWGYRDASAAIIFTTGKPSDFPGKWKHRGAFGRRRPCLSLKTSPPIAAGTERRRGLWLPGTPSPWEPAARSAKRAPCRFPPPHPSLRLPAPAARAAAAPRSTAPCPQFGGGGHPGHPPAPKGSTDPVWEPCASPKGARGRRFVPSACLLPK